MYDSRSLMVWYRVSAASGDLGGKNSNENVGESPRMMSAMCMNSDSIFVLAMTFGQPADQTNVARLVDLCFGLLANSAATSQQVRIRSNKFCFLDAESGLCALIDSVINILLGRGIAMRRASCWRREEEESMRFQIRTLLRCANNFRRICELKL